MNINNQIKLIEVLDLEKEYSKKYIDLEKYITKKAEYINRAIYIFNKAVAFKNYKKALRASRYLSMYRGQIRDGKIKEELFFNTYIDSLSLRLRILEN